MEEIAASLKQLVVIGYVIAFFLGLILGTLMAK